MRACVQRVSRAEVTVGQESVGSIEQGLVVLLGVAAGDETDDASALAAKIVGLRVFEDEAGKMNRSLDEIGGSLLVISQFTLLGDCRKGRRPSFVAAAEPELGRQLYEQFIQAARDLRVAVETGRFGAMMSVSLVNEGPVTLLLDSRRLF